MLHFTVNVICYAALTLNRYPIHCYYIQERAKVEDKNALPIMANNLVSVREDLHIMPLTVAEGLY